MSASSTSSDSASLGHHEDRFWTRDDSVPAGGRKAGTYRVFVPAPIADWEFTFASEAADAIADATAALGRLKSDPENRPSLSLARSLLHSESAASSRIEGKQASQRTLARAAYNRARGRRGDRRAAEVLGNVEAMERAIAIGASDKPLRTSDLLDVHRTLLCFTDDVAIAGLLRKKQSWIGGNDYHPIGAPYVGPPHELVPNLMDDLCAFIERTDLPGVAQAAIAHAQFENIHPFVDGNGRVGRALVYTVLRRRGQLGEDVPPVSLVLASQPRNYIGGLGAYSQGRVSLWCERFAGAVSRAATETARLAEAIGALQQDFLGRLGALRSDAAARDIIAALPEHPLLDVASMQELTGKSHVSIGKAITQLQTAGVLQALDERRWGRAWECNELLKVVENFERAVAPS